MSFTTNESLAEIIGVLKSKLPDLKRMLHRRNPDVPVLHPVVEMVASLVARYERGEIIEKGDGSATKKSTHSS